MEARVYAAPQLAVDKVAQTPGAKTKRDQRRDKIGDTEEGAFGASGEDNHHRDHADQAAVERHAAVPDAEQIQRIGKKYRQVVKQHVADTAAQKTPRKPA